VRNVFATATKHHLCVYHISLNFTEHIKKCFSDFGDWKVVLDALWRVAKETDQRKANDAAFNQEFDAIVAYVENADCTAKIKKGALKWLESLRERREKWAARYTWAVFTFGVHSTQVRSCACFLSVADPCGDQQAAAPSNLRLAKGLDELSSGLTRYGSPGWIVFRLDDDVLVHENFDKSGTARAALDDYD